MSFRQSRSPRFNNVLNVPALFVLPSIDTSAMTDTGVYSAVAVGNLSSAGSGITEYGFVWSTNASPTTGDNKATVTYLGTGSYNAIISGLASNTQYHYRAYAINTGGTVYGSDIPFATGIMNQSNFALFMGA